MFLDPTPEIRKKHRFASNEYLYDDNVVVIRADWFGNRTIEVVRPHHIPTSDLTGSVVGLCQCIAVTTPTTASVIDTPFGFCVEDGRRYYASDFYDSKTDPLLLVEQVAVHVIDQAQWNVTERIHEAVQRILALVPEQCDTRPTESSI